MHSDANTAPPPLRLAIAADAGGIAAIYAPIVERTSISFEVDAPGEAEIAQRIAGAHDCWPWLVAVDERGVLGYAYAGQHRSRAAYRWSVDVAVYVAEHARRCGLAKRLYRALFAILSEQGYRNAFAGVTLPNEPSVALHRALDFVPVGTYHNVGYKLGRWHDVAWFGRELRSPSKAVREPLPLAAIAGQIDAIVAPQPPAKPLRNFPA